MFSESSSESICTRDSDLAVKCEFRFWRFSFWLWVWWLFYVQFRFWRFSFWSIKKSRGHAWLMHIQNVNLPVDVEVEMSLSDWSGNLGPTRGVISLARKFPNSKNERENLIYISWPCLEQNPILLLLPSPEFLRWKLHKLCFWLSILMADLGEERDKYLACYIKLCFWLSILMADLDKSGTGDWLIIFRISGSARLS